MAARATIWLGMALLAAGCMFDASVRVARPDGALAFGRDDEAAARAIAVEIARAADFTQVEPPAALSDHPSSRYRWIAALSGEGSEQDTVRVAVGLRKDGREIRVSVRDDTRGTPRPPTQKLIDDLRVALEQAFPDCRVEVTSRRKPRLFGP